MFLLVKWVSNEVGVVFLYLINGFICIGHAGHKNVCT